MFKNKIKLKKKEKKTKQKRIKYLERGKKKNNKPK